MENRRFLSAIEAQERYGIKQVDFLLVGRTG